MGGAGALDLPRRLPRHRRPAAAPAGPGGDRPDARGLRAREGRLRAPLRDRQPPRLGVDPRGGDSEAERAGRPNLVTLPATHVRAWTTITRRAGASSVAPIATAIGASCVLPSLGARGPVPGRRHWEGHR